ncbi:MAG TPA: GNAT family N-acetyltransferase [Blastocatellia bacterium]|jgi:GNAT superfamily N-acetyltransferase
MLFCDLALARRLETTDALMGARYVGSHASLHPDEGSTFIEVAGGYASFAGLNSPMTQAFALGLNGPVTEDEIEKMEEFYKSLGAPVNVEVCPLADSTLISIFKSRGYSVLEYSNVLVRELSKSESYLQGESRVEVRNPKPSEVNLWARTIGQSFIETDDVAQSVVDLFITFFHTVATTCFAAYIDGRQAGGGLVMINEDVASLAATGTIPSFRNQGAQTALIQARLAFAAASGCDLAMVTTMPGSTSQRNVERQGFRVVYTRSKLIREWSPE